MGSAMYSSLVGLLGKFKNLKVFRKEFKSDAREKQKQIEAEREKLIAQFPEFDEEAFQEVELEYKERKAKYEKIYAAQVHLNQEVAKLQRVLEK